MIDRRAAVHVGVRSEAYPSQTMSLSFAFTSFNPPGAPHQSHPIRPVALGKADLPDRGCIPSVIPSSSGV